VKRATIVFAALLALSAALAGCDEDPVVTSAPTSGAASPGSPVLGPRDALAARAAAAKDLRQIAFYVLKSNGRPDRTVAVTRAVDGSWRVDIPGGARGGAVDIAIVYAGKALYECVLPNGGCVRLQGALPKTADPLVQHLFSDWLAILTDRQQALAVSATPLLPGAAGECYAIESSATSLRLPLDAGIYCYAEDGTLTAARLSFGTMVLAGRPGAAPPTLQLPGPIVSGQPLPLAAPPSPTASASAAASTRT
jgi:hypothetical protein